MKIIRLSCDLISSSPLLSSPLLSSPLLLLLSSPLESGVWSKWLLLLLSSFTSHLERKDGFCGSPSYLLSKTEETLGQGTRDVGRKSYDSPSSMA